MKPSDLRGIFPPITTPFVDGKMAYDKLADNIAKWNKSGLKGYVAFGSNGEYVYLSDEEKLEVVKTVVASAAPTGYQHSTGRSRSARAASTTSPLILPTGGESGSSGAPAWSPLTRRSRR